MLWKIRLVYSGEIVDVVEVNECISDIAIVHRWLAYKGIGPGKAPLYKAEGIMKLPGDGTVQQSSGLTPRS